MNRASVNEILRLHQCLSLAMPFIADLRGLEVSVLQPRVYCRTRVGQGMAAGLSIRTSS